MSEEAEAREVLARLLGKWKCINAAGPCDVCLEDARGFLAAVARVRLDATCATCGGTCRVGEPRESLDPRKMDPYSIEFDACPDCAGSGSSPGSLAVVEWLKSRGVLRETRFDRDGAPYDVETDDLLDDYPDVFRVSESQE